MGSLVGSPIRAWTGRHLVRAFLFFGCLVSVGVSFAFWFFGVSRIRRHLAPCNWHRAFRPDSAPGFASTSPIQNGGTHWPFNNALAFSEHGPQWRASAQSHLSVIPVFCRRPRALAHGLSKMAGTGDPRFA